MSRFFYHAHALAVAGHLRKPLEYSLDPRAACVLPSLGGQARSRAEGFSLRHPATDELLVAFSSAETFLQGVQSGPRLHRTELRASVRGLNVLNLLRAEEVLAGMVLTYDRAGHTLTVDTTGSRFAGLRLAGQPLEISLDHALSGEAADYPAFRNRHPELLESRGVTRYSLARHPLLKFEPGEAGYLDRPDFGRIYFCEWAAAPYRQSLTMLRLRLGSPAEGELEIGSIEANGNDYP